MSKNFYKDSNLDRRDALDDGTLTRSTKRSQNDKLDKFMSDKRITRSKTTYIKPEEKLLKDLAIDDQEHLTKAQANNRHGILKDFEMSEQKIF